MSEVVSMSVTGRMWQHNCLLDLCCCMRSSFTILDSRPVCGVVRLDMRIYGAGNGLAESTPGAHNTSIDKVD